MFTAVEGALEAAAAQGDGKFISQDLDISAEDISEPEVISTVVTYDDDCLRKVSNLLNLNCSKNLKIAS